MYTKKRNNTERKKERLNAWEVPLYPFSYQTPECVTACWCMRYVNYRL